jgi:dolichyl-phosphate beta-glucosyltransferase
VDIELSLVIPAFNEAERLPPYLRVIREYYSSSTFGNYEVIVVDDGSHDRTAEIIDQLFASWPQLIVLRHSRNLGKGVAVRRGVLAARGKLILFADADGATPIVEEAKLRAAIADGADLAVGSRILRATGILQHRRWHRKLGGRAFAALVNFLIPSPVRDTQCGFKMFRNNIVATIFIPILETGYLFDIHLIQLAMVNNFRISEIPINWKDVHGSKINIVRDSYRMFVGLFRLRRVIYAAKHHAASLQS